MVCGPRSYCLIIYGLWSSVILFNYLWSVVLGHFVQLSMVCGPRSYCLIIYDMWFSVILLIIYGLWQYCLICYEAVIVLQIILNMRSMKERFYDDPDDRDWMMES